MLITTCIFNYVIKVLLVSWYRELKHRLQLADVFFLFILTIIEKEQFKTTLLLLLLVHLQVFL